MTGAGSGAGGSAGSGARIAAAGIALVVIGIALWWGLSGDAPSEVDAGAATGEAEAPPDPVTPVQPPRPVHHVAESGRLAIRAGDLPDGRPVVLSLALPDEAIGDGTRPVRVVSTDGRTLDATVSRDATRDAARGSGVRLELDPQWLRPGRYLIEVKTAEKTHLPLRRYVLEVR